MFGLLSASIITSLLALGSVHVWAILCVTPLAIAAGVLALLNDAEGRLPAPVVLLLALAGYTALQAVPLPIGLVHWLDPQTASIWQTAMQPFGEQLTTASLSLDPGASMVEALKWLSYGAAFLAATSVSAGGDLRWACSLVFGASVLAALITLGHRLVGAEAFLGVYRPVFAAPVISTAPLLNANNLAGYLNLGAFSGIGLMVSRRPVLPPWALGIGVAVVVGLSAATGSRAGLAALVLGALAVVVALKVRRFDGYSTPVLVQWIAGASLLGGLALFALRADSDVWHALLQEGTQKLALISWTKPLVLDHPWFGIGRGAFETAFPAYRADQGHHVYQFAENFVMQWCCEWGVPVSLAALAGFGWFLRPSRLGLAGSPLALAAGVGAAALLLQNLLDLGLEVTALALPLFALLGALTAHANTGSESHDATEAEPGRSALAWIRKPGIALAGAGAAVWLCALLAGTHTPVRDRRAVADAYRALPASGSQDASAAQAELREQLRKAIHRHPADPFLPLVGALGARVSGTNPLPWLSRAIERDPMAGRPYLLLAEVLSKAGVKNQALLSIRQAIEREEMLMRPAVQLAFQTSHVPADLARAAPDGVSGANLLTALAQLPEAQPERLELLEAAIQKPGGFARPRLILGEDLLRALEEGKSPCDAAGAEACRARVAALARDLASRDSNQEAPTIFTARLMVLSSRLGEASRYLAQNCARFRPGLECRRWQVTLAKDAHDRAAVAEGAASYLSAACETEKGCAPAAFWLGSVFDSLGDDAQALKMYSRAAQEGELPGAWDKVAKVATRLGFVGEAKRARERAGRAPTPPISAPAQQVKDRDRLRQLVDDAEQP